MRQVHRLDQVNVEPGDLFDSAPYEEACAIVDLEAL